MAASPRRRESYQEILARQSTEKETNKVFGNSLPKEKGKTKMATTEKRPSELAMEMAAAVRKIESSPTPTPAELAAADADRILSAKETVEEINFQQQQWERNFHFLREAIGTAFKVGNNWQQLLENPTLSNEDISFVNDIYSQMSHFTMNLLMREHQELEGVL